MILNGYKVVGKLSDESLISPLEDIARVYYSNTKITYPQKGCGLLTVFKDLQSAEAFTDTLIRNNSLGYLNLPYRVIEVWKCRYGEAVGDRVHRNEKTCPLNRQCVYWIHDPAKFALAKSLTLTKCIKRIKVETAD